MINGQLTEVFMTEIMKQRHSVRQYNDHDIEPEKQKVLNELIENINKKPDCIFKSSIMSQNVLTH